MSANIFTTIGSRAFQKVMWVAQRFVPTDVAKKTFSGENSIKELAKYLKETDHKSVLVVTDSSIYKLGLVDSFIEGCKENDLKCAIFSEVVPNPTLKNIADGLKMYHENNCDNIVAIGGGSAMDCAKGIGARVGCPKYDIPDIKGLFGVTLHGASGKYPDLTAVPTTSGTGSEATLTAVISNPDKQEKYPVNDPILIPKYVVLDPLLTKGLPPHITSTTGMDALTHAVEAYIGHSNTPKTKRQAKEAVALIAKYLKRAYDDGSDLEARNGMQQAAYVAGKAFTVAYVGYVHAIAHSLGGFYGVAHGLANAVILPYVLKAFGKSAHKKLAELADLVGLEGATNEEKANNFIAWIENLNKEMNIPEKIKARDGSDIIKEEDLPVMIDHAMSESIPLYPCPEIWAREDFEAIYRQIM